MFSWPVAAGRAARSPPVQKHGEKKAFRRAQPASRSSQPCAHRSTAGCATNRVAQRRTSTVRGVARTARGSGRGEPASRRSTRDARPSLDSSSEVARLGRDGPACMRARRNSAAARERASGGPPAAARSSAAHSAKVSQARSSGRRTAQPGSSGGASITARRFKLSRESE